jgi:glutaredoxin
MKARYFKQILISFFLLCLVSLIAFGSPALAEGDVVDIYFFHSKTCPHCVKQKPLMEDLDKHNEGVKLHAYEVNEHPQIWRDFLTTHQIKSAAVPRTLIGEKQFVGYSETDGELEYNPVYEGYIGYRNQIIKAIESELGQSLNLPDSKLERQLPWQIAFLPILYLFSYPFVRQKLKTETKKRYWFGGAIATTIISLFLFLSFIPDVIIKEFARGLPFPLFVSTIALADGFNPCAFTVLIILLSLLTYTKSRKHMAIVGSTFVVTSAVMYFIFIIIMVLAGSVFLERYGAIFMSILGVIITIAGVINLKDYFFFKQGISLSLSTEQQRVISQKAGTIAKELKAGEANKKMFLTALGGTVLLAIFVNIVELGCTAILPAVYMTSLVQYCTQNIWLCFVFWTAIYAAIYIIPLLAILLNFIYSFKSSRLTEKQGRILKLVGGTFMLFCGLIMIFKPEFLIFG